MEIAICLDLMTGLYENPSLLQLIKFVFEKRRAFFGAENAVDNLVASGF